MFEDALAPRRDVSRGGCCLIINEFTSSIATILRSITCSEINERKSSKTKFVRQSLQYYQKPMTCVPNGVGCLQQNNHINDCPQITNIVM